MRSLVTFLCLFLSLAHLPDAQRLLPRASTPRFGLIKEPDVSWIHWHSFVDSITAGGEEVSLADNSVVTDGMLRNIAVQAYEEMMQTIMSGGGSKKQIPTALSVLHVSGQLFFSSSIRKAPAKTSFRQLRPESCAKAALDRCSACNSDSDHSFSGMCGEPGAVHLFCLKHPDKDPDVRAEKGLPQPNRIITVGAQGVKPPCEKSRNPQPTDWGCDSFLKKINVNHIPDTTAEEEIPSDWVFHSSPICLATSPTAPASRRFSMAKRNATDPLLELRSLLMLAS